MNRKAINFDLDVAALRKHYPNRNYLYAYKNISRFLEKEGFKHRQWSGYVSKEPLSDMQAHKILDEMFKSYPWLKQCAKKVDITNIGQTYDYLKVISDRNQPNITQEQEHDQGFDFD